MIEHVGSARGRTLVYHPTSLLPLSVERLVMDMLDLSLDVLQLPFEVDSGLPLNLLSPPIQAIELVCEHTQLPFELG